MHAYMHAQHSMHTAQDMAPILANRGEDDIHVDLVEERRHTRRQVRGQRKLRKNLTKTKTIAVKIENR